MSTLYIISMYMHDVYTVYFVHVHAWYESCTYTVHECACTCMCITVHYVHVHVWCVHCIFCACTCMCITVHYVHVQSLCVYLYIMCMYMHDVYTVHYVHVHTVHYLYTVYYVHVHVWCLYLYIMCTHERCVHVFVQQTLVYYIVCSANSCVLHMHIT
jgi:hypothetical protein